MLLRFSDIAQISQEEQTQAKSTLSGYIQRLKKASEASNYSLPESPLYLPFDENMFKEVVNAGDKLGVSNIKEFVLIGIGGSSLGATALIEALGVKSSVKFHFMDTFQREAPVIKSKAEEVLVNFVSKSGTTSESVSNLNKLLNVYPKLKNRIVVTTSNSDSIKELNVEPLSVLSIPENVGGRYSVFSPVGLFPLMAAGLNIFDLMEGAMGAVRAGTGSDILKNPSFFSSVLKFINYNKGRSLNVSFYFHPQLEGVGKWWRQLTGESLGKMGKGLTPIVSIGTQDLHSMLQLYLDGPKDKFTEFVYSENEILPEVKNVFQGVKKSYQDHMHPFVELDLQALSEKSLAYYMQTKMIETMLLASLMKINAFDQPAVEGYKQYALEDVKNPEDSA